jgi:hypothetical protein
MEVAEMAKRDDEEREQREKFLRAHDAIVRTVDCLKSDGLDGLDSEWAILEALIAHATELAETRHGPKRGRAFLRTLLRSLSSYLEVCAECGLATAERGYFVKPSIFAWQRIGGLYQPDRRVIVLTLVQPVEAVADRHRMHHAGPSRRNADCRDGLPALSEVTQIENGWLNHDR